MEMKELIIVGGPNGSGKSTFAAQFLTEFNYPFLNSDEIRKGLDDANDKRAQITAGRIFIHQLQNHLSAGNSLILESTLSGRTLVKELQKFASNGYSIRMFFVYLENAEQHLKRIEQRVVKGGHDVPMEDVLRRFQRSHLNFWKLYRDIADNWTLINNTSLDPIQVAHSVVETIEVFDLDLYNEFLKLVEHE